MSGPDQRRCSRHTSRAEARTDRPSPGRHQSRTVGPGSAEGYGSAYERSSLERTPGWSPEYLCNRKPGPPYPPAPAQNPHEQSALLFGGPGGSVSGSVAQAQVPRDTLKSQARHEPYETGANPWLPYTWVIKHPTSPHPPPRARSPSCTGRATAE